MPLPLFPLSLATLEEKMTVDAGDDLPTISDDLVVTKYKMAAEIVNSKENIVRSLCH